MACLISLHMPRGGASLPALLKPFTPEPHGVVSGLVTCGRPITPHAPGLHAHTSARPRAARVRLLLVLRWGSFLERCACRFRVDCRTCVSRCHIRWLGFTAFRRALGRKQAHALLGWNQGLRRLIACTLDLTKEQSAQRGHGGSFVSLQTRAAQRSLRRYDLRH